MDGGPYLAQAQIPGLFFCLRSLQMRGLEETGSTLGRWIPANESSWLGAVPLGSWQQGKRLLPERRCYC